MSSTVSDCVTPPDEDRPCPVCGEPARDGVHEQVVVPLSMTYSPRHDSMIVQCLPVLEWPILHVGCVAEYFRRRIDADAGAETSVPIEQFAAAWQVLLELLHEQDLTGGGPDMLLGGDGDDEQEREP